MHIEIMPQGKPRMTANDTWKPAARRYFAYCDALHLLLPKYELPESLEIVFHLPVYKSYSKKKQAELIGSPHQQKPDIDNLLKAFMDAMAPNHDDKYVWEVKASKIWSQTGGITLAGSH